MTLSIISMWISVGVIGWVAINISEGWPKTWDGPTGWKDSLTVGLTVCMVMGPLLWVFVIWGYILERYQNWAYRRLLKGQKNDR